MAISSSQPNGTGSIPFLSYVPVSYSLTEGTSIPPPPPEESKPIPSRSQPNNRSDPFAGPLSSHPPNDDVRNTDVPGYDWSRGNRANTVNSETSPNASASAAFHARVMANGAYDGPSRHGTQGSDDSNNFDPALPPHQPTRDTSRRPSIVGRFMPRLRSSSSFLRTRSRSKSSLGQFTESTSNLSQMQMTADEGRGIKRPASPPTRQESRKGASTFPRLVRKKSMDLLNSARRRSGMWSREDKSRPATRDGLIDSAVEEERQHELLRESEEMVPREPPPKIPEFRALGLGIGDGKFASEDLFMSIGR